MQPSTTGVSHAAEDGTSSKPFYRRIRVTILGAGCVLVERCMVLGMLTAVSAEYPAFKWVRFSCCNNPRPLLTLMLTLVTSAYKLQKHLKEYVTIQILEKSPQLGGTWYENKYPGCACEVPSHCHQYSFAPNPDWSKL